MTSILFVDDEDSVLQGLRRMLRPYRHQWKMTFVASGQEAVAALAEQPFDVLVTDMRMPGMDGVALLAEVMREYPQIVRIVLSGHSSKDTTIRSVGLAHQYLTKPCDRETLERVVVQALKLRETLLDQTLGQLLARIDSLPSLPSLYAELITELRSEKTTINRVGDIVAKDPAMTAKVLQLVNSAYFGLPRRISSPPQAVALLGVDTIKALVLGVGVFSQFSNSAGACLDHEAIWEHSFRTAAAAKRIALTEGVARLDTDEAFTGGLLHDVGKLVLSQAFPERYTDVLSRASERGIEDVQDERAIFGVSHAEVGAYLLAMWRLPDPVVAAVAYHHSPNSPAAVAFAPVTAVHAANVFANRWPGEKGRGSSIELNMEHLDRIGLAHRADAWREAVEPLLVGESCWSGSAGIAT